MIAVTCEEGGCCSQPHQCLSLGKDPLLFVPPGASPLDAGALGLLTALEQEPRDLPADALWLLLRAPHRLGGRWAAGQ